MINRSVLLTGAAAIALTSNAVWAAQGDTYLSLFGGYANLGETGILHYDQTSIATYVTSFQYRKLLQNNLLTVSFTTPSTYSKVFVKSSTTVGTLARTYILNETNQFSGDIESSGWVIGAALGVELLDGFRGEAEAAFRRFDLESGATLDLSNLYRRRYHVDGYYNVNNALGVTGTYTDTNSVETRSLLTSVTQADVTVTRYGTDIPARAEGELTSFSLMANVWYDFPLGDTGLKPYIGGGIGVANLTLDYRFRGLTAIPQYRTNHIGTITNTTAVGTSKIYSTTTSTTSNVYIDANFKSDDAVFAYQFGAGLGFEFENGMRLSAEYRYFATTDGDFGGLSDSIKSSDVLLRFSLPIGRGR